MINGIGNIQGIQGLQNTVNPSNDTEKSVSQSEQGENEAYNFDFSEDGWDALENNKGNNHKKDKSDKNDSQELSEDEQRKVDELERIDRKVRVHEQAHLSAAGGYARGGISYDYITGPDGKRYAKGGHVNIDTSPESEPEATIRKANIIRKAALAPADPSPTDRQMASDASKMASDAQRQLIQEEMENGKKAGSAAIKIN